MIGEVEFTQYTWFESQITTEVWRGLENFCQVLESQVLSEIEDLPANSDLLENVRTSCGVLDRRIENAESFDQTIQQQSVPLIVSTSKNTEPKCWGFGRNDLIVFITFSLLVLALILKWSESDETYSVKN